MRHLSIPKFPSFERGTLVEKSCLRSMIRALTKAERFLKTGVARQALLLSYLTQGASIE